MDNRFKLEETVRIHGLESSTGLTLNGKYGSIEVLPGEGGDRYTVRIPGAFTRMKIRPRNLLSMREDRFPQGRALHDGCCTQESLSDISFYSSRHKDPIGERRWCKEIGQHGMYATRDVEKGGLILAELPVIQLDNLRDSRDFKRQEDLAKALFAGHAGPADDRQEIYKKFQALPQAQQDIIRNMHNRLPNPIKGDDASLIQSIFVTNSMSIPLNTKDGHSDGNRLRDQLYLNLSFYNHSCTPNMMLTYREMHREIVVGSGNRHPCESEMLRGNVTNEAPVIDAHVGIALRPIKKGEQLVFDYMQGHKQVPLLCDTKTRQVRVKALLAFDCRCATCLRNDPADDKARVKAGQLVNTEQEVRRKAVLTPGKIGLNDVVSLLRLNEAIVKIFLDGNVIFSPIVHSHAHHGLSWTYLALQEPKLARAHAATAMQIAFRWNGVSSAQARKTHRFYMEHFLHEYARAFPVDEPFSYKKNMLRELYVQQRSGTTERTYATELNGLDEWIKDTPDW